MEYTLYHGTKLESVSGILRDKFLLSTKNTEWMGDGIYFYDNAKRALNWIKNCEDKAIIKVFAIVDDDKVLDLRLYVHRLGFQKVVKQFLTQNKKQVLVPTTISDVVQQKAYIRSAFCNLYCKLRTVGIIIAEIEQNITGENNAFFRGMGFSVNNDLQYCLKSNIYIKEKSLLEEII